jgi:hypothetical protein
LTRRLIMDLVFIVIFEFEYNMLSLVTDVPYLAPSPTDTIRATVLTRK